MGDSRFLLREKAKVKLPDIPREASDYLVAVLSHHKRVEDAQPVDFMWFKCRAKHTVAKIQTFYAQKSGRRADLFFGSYVPGDDVKISWLDHWGDKLIVLQAVGNETHADDNPPRTPLEPLNGPSVSNSIESIERGLKHTVKPSPSPVSSLTVPDLPKLALGGPDSFGGSQPTPHIPPGAPILKITLDAAQHAGGAFSGSQGYMPPVPPQWQFLYSQAPSQSPCEPPGNRFGNISPAASSGNILPDHRPYLSQSQWLNPSPKTHVSSLIPETPTPTVVPIPNASQNRRVQKILAESSPKILEVEVKSNIVLLDQLEIHLTNLPAKSPEAEQWLQQIKNLRQQNISEPTIIGVVGNTGAGKSSVINAMLDEERLVPTNCMRACTAVVTEMSWNSSNEENAKYRAAIEFIQPEDWEKELQILFGELLDASGNLSREAYNEDSEAGVAYAKIKAVYPLKTNQELSKSSVYDLMRDPAVRNVLGQTRNVQEARSDRFYRVLQSYVDSKEKSADDKKQKREMEFWPLIKVVKIYTKADALSTGAVIVDLPGVSDSNAARSAIASNYMKQCTGLWIVAPITRAVDDKAAKSLLGESFKRQLKYDGTYSRVTFICSKTDDISIIEASDSLGLEEEIGAKWNRSDEIEKSQNRLTKEIKDLKESKAIFGEVLSDMDDQIEAWEKTRDELEDGKTVYAPKMDSKKRKHSQKLSTQRKKRVSGRKDDEDETTDNDNNDDVASSQDDSQADTANRGMPLTEEIIEAKIAESKATKKEARSQRKRLDAKILDLRGEQKVLDSAYDEIQAEMSKICISGRNQYSKGAIQQDFAAGIKELDQENQLEVNEEEFNPDEDLRDYAEVARSLPVFCISSRAYQKLSGRLQREKDVPGFTTVEETEIPQLQAHCKKLTEAGRVSTCRRFFNGFSQLLNSLSFWASNDGSGTHLSDTQRAAEVKFLHSKLAELETGLEQAVQACLEDMKDTLTENIYEKFGKVIQAAVDEANVTAAKWGAPVNRENRSEGGYMFATYKAICRRDGVFSNAYGMHDFNLQLSEPMMKQLGSDWEKAFARRLPHVLQSFTKSTKGLLQSFHRDVQARAVKSGTSIAGLAMLGQQLETYERIFNDLTGQMVQVIGERQRDANREFTPVIAKRLLSAYEYCVAERGIGSYMRMKAHMTSYVDQHRGTMFRESTEEVRKHLRQMCTQVEEQMMNKADEVFVLMRRDYMTVVAGQHVPQGYVPPKWERSMKAEIAKLIREREEAAEKEENAEKTISDADQDINANGPSPHTLPVTEFGSIPGEAPPIGNILNSIVETIKQEIKSEFEY